MYFRHLRSCQWHQKAATAKVALAVPVASPKAVTLQADSDDGVCLFQPPSMAAIGYFGSDLNQLTDDGVNRLLAPFSADSGKWSPVLFPSALSVAQYLWGAMMDGTLFEAIRVTLQRLLLGYAIGVVVGLPLTMVPGPSRRFTLELPEQWVRRVCIFGPWSCCQLPCRSL